MKIAIESPVAPGNNANPNFESATGTLSRRQAWELSWPYLGGFALGAATSIAVSESWLQVPAQIKDALVAVAGIAGTFAGFMLAAAAILASIGDRPFIRRAKRAGVYGSLIRFLFVAMRWAIYTAVCSVVGILFDPAWKTPFYAIGIGAWTFSAFTALFASIRALTFFTQVMNYVSED